MLSVPFNIPWDVRDKNARVDQTFEVQERQFYQLYLGFILTGSKSEESLERLLETFGDGSRGRVTPESAGSDNPVAVEDFTPEELAQIQSGAQARISSGGVTILTQGVVLSSRPVTALPPFVWQFTKQGAGIPIRVATGITKLSEGGDVVSTILNTSIETKGIDAGGRRGISSFAMDPGIYHIEAITLQDTPIPAEVETSLVLTWNPNIKPSRK